MATPDGKADRAKVQAEAQFKRGENAKVVTTVVEQEAAAEREKTVRLKAQRLAREQTEAAMPKLAKTSKRVRKGISST